MRVPQGSGTLSDRRIFCAISDIGIDYGISLGVLSAQWMRVTLHTQTGSCKGWKTHAVLEKLGIRMEQSTDRTLMKPTGCEVHGIVSIPSITGNLDQLRAEHPQGWSLYLLGKLLGAQSNSVLPRSLYRTYTQGAIVQMNLSRVELLIGPIYKGNSSSHVLWGTGLSYCIEYQWHGELPTLGSRMQLVSHQLFLERQLQRAWKLPIDTHKFNMTVNIIINIIIAMRHTVLRALMLETLLEALRKGLEIVLKIALVTYFALPYSSSLESIA